MSISIRIGRDESMLDLFYCDDQAQHLCVYSEDGQARYVDERLITPAPFDG